MSEEAAEQQAGRATARVLAILAAYQAGELTRPDTQTAVAVAVYTAKVLASRLADITVSTLAQRPPLGIVPGLAHVERLEVSAQTILSEPESQPERLERLARAETWESHRKALHAAIREQGFGHWQRVVQPGACDECLKYADEVQPITRHLWDHEQCRCTLRPHGTPYLETESEPDSRPLVTIRRTA